MKYSPLLKGEKPFMEERRNSPFLRAEPPGSTKAGTIPV